MNGRGHPGLDRVRWRDSRRAMDACVSESVTILRSDCRPPDDRTTELPSDKRLYIPLIAEDDRHLVSRWLYIPLSARKWCVTPFRGKVNGL
jgi:hypothetical protein